MAGPRGRLRSLARVLVGCLVASCESPEPVSYVGGAACAGCHAAETEAWAGSHHDLAMEPATGETVLGDFDDAVFAIEGDTTRFRRRDGRLLVTATGSDGARAEFEVTHTFGVEPLQQLLVAFPGGRRQAFGVAWDTRPAEEGGQRWFHLYPDDPPEPGDPLHWTGIDQTWNYQCAECHSTDLRKGYDRATDAYETVWSDIDVSCEACHGPGSRHVEIAEGAAAGATPGVGWAIQRAGDAQGATWIIAPGETIATRSPPATGGTSPTGASPAGGVQIDACGRCHSRRGVIADPERPGAALLDTHRPSLLAGGLYHPDGQILDEVYVWGSFLQSRMHRAGVTCTDCHDPHRASVVAEGNALCARCHLASAYDVPEHTLHEAGTAGSACVDCHMPTRTYMVVDPRRDHGFRIPRPDLAASIGVPEPCTGCHADRDPGWAADALAERFGAPADHPFAAAFAAARAGDPRSAPALAAVVGDAGQAGIVRATAASLLVAFQHPDVAAAIDRALRDPDPLVRLGGLSAVGAPRASTHWRTVFGLLSDSLRAIRLDAARALAPVPPVLFSDAQRSAVAGGVEDYVTAQLVNADRPEAWLNIGAIRGARGDTEAAAGAYRTAIEVDPTFAPAYANAAELQRNAGREEEAEAMLRRGLAADTSAAALHHALGLSLVRQGRHAEALEPLARARSLDPDNSRFGFVYAIGLSSAGDIEGALTELEAALEATPFDREVLSALATLSRQAGRTQDALDYARRVADIWSFDPSARQLLDALQRPDGGS
ncbi:MAG: tetratricopeptide repeat protein [Gemmatimonadota bacterium]|nr:tetratricopeptide repeat protein [Gemmatimonadota bacterium]